MPRDWVALALNSVSDTAKLFAAAVCNVIHGITLQLADFRFWLKLGCCAHP